MQQTPPSEPHSMRGILSRTSGAGTYAITKHATRIRPGRTEEVEILNTLTRRSVMYWGYEPAFLEWEPESITIDERFIKRRTTWVLEIEGEVAGYFAFVRRSGELALDKLFLDPRWIGCGYGRLLWNHAVEEASRRGYSSFRLFADPNAAPFYTKVGARFIEEIPTGWPGWNLHSFVHEF